MFARCGLEVEFDFSLPKTKKTKTDDYPLRERSAKVEAKRRDLQERIKAESNHRQHHGLSPTGLSSLPRTENYADRNVIAGAGDGSAATRSVTQAEYELFKENKRLERYACESTTFISQTLTHASCTCSYHTTPPPLVRYALWEDGFHLPDPPNTFPAQPWGGDMHYHRDIGKSDSEIGNSSHHHFHDSPNGHISSSESSPVLLSPKPSSHSPSSSRYYS